MLQAFILPFLTVFFAELLDKSQLTVLLLAAKTQKHLQLFLGVILAFAIVDGAAILFGALISTIFPQVIMRILSGLLFIIFGVLTLRTSYSEEKKENHLSNPFLAGFSLVFFSEWGDKTQIASAVFAAEYPPLSVFVSVIAALALLSLLAIIISSKLLMRLNKRRVKLISGIVFILLGIFFLTFRNT